MYIPCFRVLEKSVQDMDTMAMPIAAALVYEAMERRRIYAV